MKHNNNKDLFSKIQEGDLSTLSPEERALYLEYFGEDEEQCVAKITQQSKQFFSEQPQHLTPAPETLERLKQAQKKRPAHASGFSITWIAEQLFGNRVPAYQVSLAFVMIIGIFCFGYNNSNNPNGNSMDYLYAVDTLEQKAVASTDTNAIQTTTDTNTTIYQWLPEEGVHNRMKDTAMLQSTRNEMEEIDVETSVYDYSMIDFPQYRNTVGVKRESTEVYLTSDYLHREHINLII